MKIYKLVDQTGRFPVMVVAALTLDSALEMHPQGAKWIGSEWILNREAVDYVSPNERTAYILGESYAEKEGILL